MVRRARKIDAFGGITAGSITYLTSAANVGVPNAVPTGDVVRDAATANGLIRFNTFDPRFLNSTLPDPEFYSPYSQQWSLGIQRELGTGVTLNQFKPSPTGFYLLSDLNKGIFTSINPSAARLVLNGAGAAMKFGTPFGSLGRNTFLGDRNENVDLSIFKTFHIKERFKFQYRLQLSNAFNHPFFGIPNSILLDNAGTTYFNFQENDGGRRTISMGISVIF